MGWKYISVYWLMGDGRGITGDGRSMYSMIGEIHSCIYTTPHDMT